MRLVLVAVWLVAMATASDSFEDIAVGQSSGENWDEPTVDVVGDDNTTVFQPADDFIPKASRDDDAASKSQETRPSDGGGGGLSTSAVGVIVSVSVVGVVLAAGMVVYAWRASRQAEEGTFVDLGDDRSYAYGRFGDYAAM